MAFPFLSGLTERVPDDPFYQPRRPYWLPREMTTPPALAPGAAAGPLERRFALLINPFYPKHPHGSFGKHVLTPALALTSIAGATPPAWRVQFWVAFRRRLANEGPVETVSPLELLPQRPRRRNDLASETAPAAVLQSTL